MNHILPFDFTPPPIRYINNMDPYYAAIEAGDDKLLKLLIEDGELRDFMETYMMSLEECKTVYIFNFVRCYFLAVKKGVSEYTLYPYTAYFINVFYQVTDASKLKKMMIEIMFFFTEVIRLSEREAVSPLIQSAIEYIEKYLESKITVMELSKHCKASVSSIAHHFKRELGVAPVEYINQRRIQRACIMLKYSGLSCTEIAETLGFCSQSYFGKMFKQATGYTPKQYVKVLKKNNHSFF